MNKIKLLLVEDDENFAFMMKNSLEYIGGYNICIAYDGKEGLDLYKTFEPDVIVADIEMPIMSGKEMLRIIREYDAYIPVIFLTAHKDATSYINGLDMGADVYMRKPIIGVELDARIRSLLRIVSNRGLPVKGEGECVIGIFGFSAIGRYLCSNGKLTTLTNTETKILNLLVAKKGQLVQREDILNSIGSENYNLSSRSLDVHILNLRKKLARDSSVEIVSVRSVGYILKDGFSST